MTYINMIDDEYDDDQLRLEVTARIKMDGIDTWRDWLEELLVSGSSRDPVQDRKALEEAAWRLDRGEDREALHCLCRALGYRFRRLEDLANTY